MRVSVLVVCECSLLVDGAVRIPACLVHMLVRVGVVLGAGVGVVCMRRRLACGV